MARIIIIGILLLGISIFLGMSGCEREKIVESKEYIHDTEYITLPSDTVLLIDTVIVYDSTSITDIDSVFIVDTVVQVNYFYDTTRIYDTVTTVQYIHDTITTIQYVHDTVTTVQYIYDTSFATDTVQISQCNPNEYLAFSALQYYSDDIVFEVINQEVGYTDGYVFYLSAFQTSLTQQSLDVYDIYGYIDYWAPEWVDFYSFEYYWRMTYTGGDPANPNNWTISEPPGNAPNFQPGLRLIPDQTEKIPSSR